MLKGFKKRIKLGKFVSATLDNTIKNIGDTDLVKKPEALTGTVLFSDIRDFTSISEKQGPEIVAQMLNSHLDAMSNEIQLYGGRIEQFIGDAIVAVFFNPDGEQSTSIDSAINAAIAMRLRHEEIQKNRQRNGLFTYEIGVGIEYGDLTTGMISTGSRSEFIVLGQARVRAEQFETESKLGRFSRIITSAFIKEQNSHNLSFEKLNGSENFEIKI
jgi:adenylate cyclase